VGRDDAGGGALVVLVRGLRHLVGVGHTVRRGRGLRSGSHWAPPWAMGEAVPALRRGDVTVMRLPR
jgi:hypothetical protein